MKMNNSDETKNWLSLLRDRVKIQEDKIKPLLTETEEISKIIAASLLTMKNKR